MDMREVLNALFCVLSTGCRWQALPKDLLPKSTVWGYGAPFGSPRCAEDAALGHRHALLGVWPL